MKKGITCLLALVAYSGLFAQDADSYQKLMELPIKKEIRKNGDIYLQGNFTEILTGKKNENELLGETQEMLKIANAPHPNVETLRKYLKDAATEFKVPFSILDAIAKTYNNYSMIGPSQYGAYGIMGLIENDEIHTLAQAAEIVHISPETVKTNPKQNIRAAAALLAQYKGGKSNNLIDWFDAVKQLTGLSDEQTREMQAIDYFKVMNEGRATITLWKEDANIIPLHNETIKQLITDYNAKIEAENSANRGATTGTLDYPSGISAFTDCNYSSRGGTDIDTWTNHYIGSGTVAGAISWFRNCRGSSGSSAHFIVAVDGKVYQCVPVASKAWHAGASGQPNNERSIGTEHDITSSTPSNWNNTTLLKASTDLARYFCNKYAIPKTRSLPGIRGHQEMPGTSTDCPANIPWTTWMNLLINGGTTTNNIPTLNTPSAGANVNSPVNLTWSSSVSGASYRIQISKVNTGWTAANGFTTNTTTSSNIPVNYSAAGLVNYTWPNQDTASANFPTAGSTYYWTVRSYSEATGTSSYSPVRSFKVINTSKNQLSNSQMLIYPNPSNGDITVAFESTNTSAELTLFDLKGTSVYSKKYAIKKGTNIITGKINVKNGNYILFINDGEKVISQNVIIKN